MTADVPRADIPRAGTPPVGTPSAGTPLTETALEDLSATFRFGRRALVEAAATYAETDGALDPDLMRALGESAHDGLAIRLLQAVAEPVARLTIHARRGELFDEAAGWIAPDVSVLAFSTDPAGGSDPGGGTDPASGSDPEGGTALDEVLVASTTWLPLQLAATLDLGPRQRAHGVAEPLSLPTKVLSELLVAGPSNGSVPTVDLPPDLPSGWRSVFDAWSGSSVRTITVTVGHASPGGAERWRSITLLDDVAHGLWIADQPLVPNAGEGTTILAPTDPTYVLDLLSSLLRP